MEFIGRLAALVPKPGVNLTRFDSEHPVPPKERFEREPRRHYGLASIRWFALSQDVSLSRVRAPWRFDAIV